MTGQPTVTHTETTATVVHTYQISGAPALPLKYRSAAIIPERVTVKFVNGDWTRMDIAGSRAKKDGTSGDSSHVNEYWRERGGVPEDMPEWAVPLTDPNHARTAITEAGE